jgi:hypothetical protein
MRPSQLFQSSIGVLIGQDLTKRYSIPREALAPANLRDKIAHVAKRQEARAAPH